jgi:hypothetical protein
VDGDVANEAVAVAIVDEALPVAESTRLALNTTTTMPML